ncbi:MAG: hypothetical protein PVG38_06515 [Gammaproteobacteria bacterium]
MIVSISFFTFHSAQQRLNMRATAALSRPMETRSENDYAESSNAPEGQGGRRIPPSSSSSWRMRALTADWLT